MVRMLVFNITLHSIKSFVLMGINKNTEKRLFMDVMQCFLGLKNTPSKLIHPILTCLMY